MNRQDIIDMISKVYGVVWTNEAQLKDLEKFAALVASAERNEIIQILEDSTGYVQMDLIRERGNVATNDTSQERVDKTSESVHDPVAWISATELLVMRGNALGGAKDWRVNLGLEPEEGDVGLYTTPPQRTWVGLTDEEVINVMPDDDTPMSLGEAFSKFAELIEAKLKEKNT